MNAWDFTVITRQQARTESQQKIAVKTLTGDDLVGTFKLPSGLKNGKTIRISKLRLEERLPGDHAWPDDGVKVRIRVPDWRLRNGVVALFVLAGVIAGAWPYTTLLVAIWGISALSARHNRLHAVGRFDPAVPWRFWPVFRDTLASTAMLYLLPIGAVIAFYLAVAAVFRFADGVLTIHQLETAQRVLSAVSEFVDTWIKLKEGSMLLALVGVWLLTCLLLAWRGRGTVQAGSPAGRLRRMRYGLAQALNRTAGAYARYSGPIAATVVTLASFTFLTNVSSNLGTQLHLQAVVRTEDYTYAAEKIEAELTAQVVSQLYTQIKNVMPPDYQQATAVPLPEQVARTRQQADRLVVPLQKSDPAAAEHLATEENRVQNVQNLADQSVVDGARGSDPVDVPHDLTAEQAAAAREQAESDHSDDRVEIINDSGKEVFLQLEKVASEQGWTSLKNLVNNRFPLAAPMIDTLAEACDEQLQETLREKIPALVKQLTNKASDIKSSIAAAAKDIVATVNVSNLVRDHATNASHLATGQRDTLTYLKVLEDQFKFRADIVQGLTRPANDGEFDTNIHRVLGSSNQSLQTGMVNDLRSIMQTPDSPDQNANTLRHNAAVAIHRLGENGLPMITEADIQTAVPLCQCTRG
jgi:ElaB/YqjD/DUF883 family membrane-anchored ribosome-binding protein